MKTIRLNHIAVRQSSKVLGVFYMILGLVYVPLGWLADTASPPDEQLGGFWLLAPLFFGVFAFIATAVMAALYNVVAARLGGLEFSVDTPAGIVDHSLPGNDGTSSA